METVNPQELIKSVSIENLVMQRESVLERLQVIYDMLKETESISRSAGLGDCEYWLKDRYGCGMFRIDDLIDTATNEIDSTGWQYLMSESGMRTYMDKQAREEWDKKIMERNVPPLTFENIRATFKLLFETKNEIFERGVINIFKSLSWDYKTNSPCKFGKKIILNNMVDYHRQYGFSIYTSNLNTLVDLERIFHIIEHQPIPDHRHDIAERVYQAVRQGNGPELPDNTYEDERFLIRWYQKGSLHVTFKQPELIQALNTILVRHYPDALPARL